MTTLIIPDVHQDFRYLERILKAVRVEDFERVVFLGDLFDSREVDFRGPESAARTARLIKSLADRLGPRLTLLCGNHDLPYFTEAMFRFQGGIRRESARQALRKLGVRPESEETLEAVLDCWGPDMWHRLQPFALVGDYLLSHAGLHRSWLPPRGLARDISKSLPVVQQQWDRAIDGLLRKYQVGNILAPGAARGGEEDQVGGPTWLDWEREFADDLPIGQVVGHTCSTESRQRGRSWCIDYSQCAYATLSPDLQVHGV